MSETELENAESVEDACAHDFIQLKAMSEIIKLDKSQLYTYIEKLHGIIRKYDHKFAKYKHKLKTFLENEDKSYADKSSQVLNNDLLQSNEPELEENKDENASKELSATDAFNFVDEMRQVAKHAENLSNFVYEPTSGMYYDPKSGYYYNAEYGLYYDGTTGCYYSYDEAKDSFEFHSQAQVQAGGTTKVDNDDDGLGADDEVEFDEWGGVITDKTTLKQIKAEKEKIKERAAKKKRKAKKKHKKKSKSHKERRHRHHHHQHHHHKAKKRHKRDRGSDKEDDDCLNDREKRRSRKRDFEDGELSQSSSANSDSSSSSSSSSNSSSDEEADSSVPLFKAAGRFQDIAKKYPPSLRIIVHETNLDTLTVGSLHLITYKGGTLGREGVHDVIIPDVNVSKCHLKFQYDTKKCIYKCHDLGSRNGTLLNGTRMSASKASSEAHDLVHGSVIQISQTKLLCHVHEGNSTCGLCEPGLLIEPPTRESAASTTVTTLSHKEQLKKLQKKYGLENEKFVETKSVSGQSYNDRAATRRTQVGSSTDKEKTEVACVNTEIASSNKGFKMLSKLGWQKGDTLGKTNSTTGLLEPINVVANEGTAGLGSEQVNTTCARPVDKRKLANLKITQQRYQRAKDIFVLSDDSD